MTSIRTLNANFTEKAEYLERISEQPSLLQEQAKALLEAFNGEYSNAADLLQLLHQTQRLRLIESAGAADNAELQAELKKTTGVEWKDAPTLPVEDSLQENVGKQFLKAPLTKPGANILINASPYATKITETLVEGYIQRGELFDVNVADVDFNARLLNGVDVEGAKGAGAYQSLLHDRAEKSILIRTKPRGEVATIEDAEKRKAFSAYAKEFGGKAGSVDNFYTLTSVPTPEDAEIDGLDYKAYLQLFFELCDQPWDEVTAAQQKLVTQFDKGKEVHLKNDDGTDLKIDITNFTFANSVIKKNIPGGEIFSGVEREGVNGILVSKGKFAAPTGGIVENMTLTFKDGKIIEAHAEKGEENLLKALDDDPKGNSRYLGEIGIGTNPWLDRHVLNSLLVEKIGGSFHLAIGNCYTYTEYDGDPVKMDNGNHSTFHWDVTTLLKGNGGKLYLDGELLQDNGQWLDPELKVLNEGWKAIPEKERPAYWQARLKEEPAQEQKQPSSHVARLAAGKAAGEKAAGGGLSA